MATALTGCAVAAPPLVTVPWRLRVLCSQLLGKDGDSVPGTGSGPASVRALRSISRAEVALHCTADDCWIVIGDIVVDVTRFWRAHPGGDRFLLPFAGGDATAAFDRDHTRDYIERFTPEEIVGRLAPK